MKSAEEKAAGELEAEALKRIQAALEANQPARSVPLRCASQCLDHHIQSLTPYGQACEMLGLDLSFFLLPASASRVLKAHTTTVPG